MVLTHLHAHARTHACSERKLNRDSKDRHVDKPGATREDSRCHPMVPLTIRKVSKILLLCKPFIPVVSYLVFLRVNK